MQAELGRVSLPQKLFGARDDLADAHRPIEHGIDSRQFDGFCPRRNHDRGDALYELQNCRIAGDFGHCLHHDDCGHLPARDGTPRVVDGFHAQRVDAAFAKLRADAGAQRPIASDHENGWHPGQRA